jgi:SNW domain-containing protein 1
MKTDNPVSVLTPVKQKPFIVPSLFLPRFVPDKEFSGSDRRQRGREGPVQFEEDPFGLDKFLEEAKQHGGSKRPSDSSRPKEHEHEGKKRRKE